MSRIRATRTVPLPALWSAESWAVYVRDTAEALRAEAIPLVGRGAGQSALTVDHTARTLAVTLEWDA